MLESKFQRNIQTIRKNKFFKFTLEVQGGVYIPYCFPSKGLLFFWNLRTSQIVKAHISALQVNGFFFSVN